jgi:ABC-2 type transport system permease protein
MSKVSTVAGAEFGMLVRTRAFIITVALVPVLMMGSVAIQGLVAKQVDDTPRRFAVVDRTGVLYDPIAAAARLRADALQAGLAVGARFLPEKIEAQGREPDEVRLELSERVQAGEIFAFVDIAPGVLAPGIFGRVYYFSEHPTQDDLRRWLDQAINDEVRGLRLKGAGVDPDIVTRLDQPVPVENLGLLTRTPSGEVKQAERVDSVRAYIVPLGLMYILFLTIFMSAPQLMNAVMQEKMSKISEVLIGSVSAFELMLGKLAGSAATSVVLAVVYLGGGLAVAAYWGHAGLLTPQLVFFFLIFMSLAVLFYGSIFIAVGAACSDLKDAQSLITPVMLVAVVPMFAWQAVLRSPMSPFSIAISLFPPATPFMMLLRLAVTPTPPWWQVALGVALTGAATLGCVWAAARIFRIGILATGKSAGLAQMIRWLRIR